MHPIVLWNTASRTFLLVFPITSECGTRGRIDAVAGCIVLCRLWLSAFHRAVGGDYPSATQPLQITFYAILGGITITGNCWNTTKTEGDEAASFCVEKVSTTPKINTLVIRNGIRCCLFHDNYEIGPLGPFPSSWHRRK